MQKKKKHWLGCFGLTLALSCLYFSGKSQDYINPSMAFSIDKGEENQKGEQQYSYKSLKETLQELQKIYKIEFSYQSPIAQNQFLKVPASLVGAKDFDALLAEILDQSNFKFKKVNNVYIIYKDEQSLLRNELENAGNLANRKSNSSLVDFVLAGKVVDSKGEPLPGVTVLLKGTTTGTATGADGSYQLSVPEGPGTLIFSFIGFTTQEIAFSGAGTINVTLAEGSKALEEVVVTALGIRKEVRKLGYSTSTIETENIQTTRTTNVGNSLVGKVAGLSVQAPPTGPGGSSKIRIRGQSSFGGNNSPLIIVNGVPINNTPSGTANGDGGPGFVRTDNGDGLQSINPDDIESMTVLKGAAAAVLYGFRAKDGAIIITTKSGKGQSGIGVEFNSNFQVDQALDFSDFQYEYGGGENGIRPRTVAEARNSGTWSFGERFDKENGALTPQVDGTIKPYLPYKNRVRDFYRAGTSWTNSVAVSGSNERGNFRLSFANTDAKGIVPNSDFHKKILNFGLNYNLSEKLSVQLNANYSREHNHNPPGLGQQAWNVNQTLMTLGTSIDINWLKIPSGYMDENGNEVGVSRFASRINPYWITNKRIENIYRDRLFGNASVRYQFTPWLYAQGRVGQDYFNSPQDIINPTGSIINGPPLNAAGAYSGSFYRGVSSFRETNLDFLIGANQELGSFGIDATFGGNSMDQVSDRVGTIVNTFFVRDLYTINNGVVKDPQYTYAHKRVNSLYATVDFSYRNYLYLNFSGRNDWFSTLNPKSNSYLYPAISTSFVFSEAFQFLPAWLNFGKIRAAYAEVGGDTQPYTNALFYNINANQFPVGSSQLGVGQISGTINPNPDLKPLKVKEVEAGIELRTLNNRVNLDLSVYRKNTVDEILDVTISPASGFNSTKVNVGRLRNQGIELLLNLVPVQLNSFTWESGFNMAINKSEVLELAGGQTRLDVASNPEFIGLLSHEVGKPLASLRGIDFKRDAQGRIITSSGRFQIGNIVTYGSAIPTHTGGWLNTFTYKGIRLFTQIDFKAGHKLISNSEFNYHRHGLSKASLVGRETGVVFPGFNEDGSPNTIAVPADAFYADYRNVNASTPFVYNASFVRWRTVSLGYDFSRLIKKSFLKGLSANLFVNNVLFIKRYTENIDPESQFSASDNSTGIEFHGLPTTRSYGLNINVKL